MSTHLDDDLDLDARLRAADPVDATALHRAAGSAAARDLCTAITRSGPPARVRARHVRRGLAALAVAAAVITALVLVFVQPSAPDRAYGAALVRFAENSPRLLVGAAGWPVSRADEYGESGEMTFAAGGRSLDVFWVPGATGKDDDKPDLIHEGFARIDGEQAWIGSFGRGDAQDFEAIWSVGDQAREARGTFPSRAAFLAVASTLHRVDTDTWLAAMPASVVAPGSRRAAVDSMLADIPRPKGFDAGALTSSGEVSDRYQLGAAVTGAVACAWVHQWTVGDDAARAQAAQAMRTSRQWAVLRRMASQGEWSQTVWMIADAMNGHPFERAPGQTLEQWTRPALGC